MLKVKHAIGLSILGITIDAGVIWAGVVAAKDVSSKAIVVGISPRNIIRLI